MIEDVVYKCDACDAREIIRPYLVTERCEKCKTWSATEPSLPGCYGGLAADVIRTNMPDGWRRSFGSSGRGFYHLCFKCVALNIRIDDAKGRKVICYGGFLDG